MTWSQLQTFVAVAQTGSVRAAAVRLSVTESAVSASLANLQKALGFPLVERSGRGLVLTAAGDVYVEYAERVLGMLDEAALTAASADAPERGRLRLAAVPTASEYLVPGLLASFHRRYPDVDVTLEVGARDAVSQLLAVHRCDLMIGGRPPDGSGFVTRAKRDNALVVVGAVGAVHDPARSTWLLRELGSGTRATTLALLESLELTPPTITVGSHGAVVASATLGLGIGLVSRDAVERPLADGEVALVPVSGTPMSRPWHLVTHGRTSATAELFVRHITTKAAAGERPFTRTRLPTSEPPMRRSARRS